MIEMILNETMKRMRIRSVRFTFGINSNRRRSSVHSNGSTAVKWSRLTSDWWWPMTSEKLPVERPRQVIFTSFKTINKSKRSLVVWERHKRWKSVSLTERNEPIGAIKQIRCKMILKRGQHFRSLRETSRVPTDKLFDEDEDHWRCFSHTWCNAHRLSDCRGMRSPLANNVSWKRRERWRETNDFLLLEDFTKQNRWTADSNKSFEIMTGSVNHGVRERRFVGEFDRIFSIIRWSNWFDTPSAELIVDNNPIQSDSRRRFHRLEPRTLLKNEQKRRTNVTVKLPMLNERKRKHDKNLSFSTFCYLRWNRRAVSIENFQFRCAQLTCFTP